MKFIYVDDEKTAITNFDFYVKGRPLVKSIEYFTNPQEAVIYAQNNVFDVAFLDIEMPILSGFELATALKKHQPDIEIIYVTAYNQYHQEAYQSGGRAYLLKPFSKEDMDGVFAFLRKLSPAEGSVADVHAPLQKPTIFVQTFGNFDLWVHGAPVIFKNAKSKELLAVLVNHRGSVVRNIEIFNFLWPDKVYSKTTATYVRKVVQALKKQLDECGCPELVTFSRNAFHVNPDAFICDYYTVATGSTYYLASYNGYYMAQYPWAEESIYIIEQNIKALSAQLQTAAVV